MFDEIKTWLLNTANVSFTGAVLLDWIDQGLAIVAGGTLIWMNVERALRMRRERQQKDK